MQDNSISKQRPCNHNFTFLAASKWLPCTFWAASCPKWRLLFQSDNDRHSILNDVTAPMTTASTRLQADIDCHSILNDVISPQAFSTLTATLTVTMTQVPVITTAIMKVKIKLDESFLHPAKVFVLCPFWLSNYDRKNSHTKSLAAFRPRQLSNYDGNTCQFLTSVDCWVIFNGSPTSCSSHHSHWLVQVDWCIDFWQSNICSIKFSRCFLHKQIESWGSMCYSNLSSNLQVDCNVFQNIPLLPQRLRYILWERMGATVATWQTQQPCLPQPYHSPWPCKTNWLCWPYWSCWLHWPQHSYWPRELHWPQWPYRPHWSYQLHNWPCRPCWPHQLHCPHQTQWL